MVKKYKKKPIEIEALQFVGGYKSYCEVIQFVGASFGSDENSETGECTYIDILTNEGIMRASINDYIIKEPYPQKSREFYPCKPEIFKMTYEEIKGGG